MQDSHSASTPLSSPVTLTIHHRKSQQMSSFNSGCEWWCALALRWLGVWSLVSKEFVSGMDILIGPLTFGKTPSGIKMSCLFLSFTKLQLRPFSHTPLTTSLYGLIPLITAGTFFLSSGLHTSTAAPFSPKDSKGKLQKVTNKFPDWIVRPCTNHNGCESHRNGIRLTVLKNKSVDRLLLNSYKKNSVIENHTRLSGLSYL